MIFKDIRNYDFSLSSSILRKILLNVKVKGLGRYSKLISFSKINRFLIYIKYIY